ncbi:MAG TPA: PKD domain-containing protein [Candidatus Paceibacterota bacterium]|nr:PKD domain-containing protein [Verrucomicrobiota bacterium]HRY51543.1 PKD domain-containing protein [Candidatus Paceibacterota bacterium]
MELAIHWRVAMLVLTWASAALAQAPDPIQDPLFTKPYVDVDEWREKPVRHRYVHGGFRETETRFSIYFPAKERYQGRFFQHITPIPIDENLAQRRTGEENFIGFSVGSGGYFLESNGGGMTTLAPGSDASIGGYRANAAVARYSRVLAGEMYGPHRTYGYAFGGSGGGFKTIAGFENTDAWDGAVPYVIGSPMAIPHAFTVRALALRVLKDKLPAIVDAVEPGGSGDMYAGLNNEEKSVLLEVTRMGFPPRGWFAHKTLGLGALPIFFPGIVASDPQYFRDFWTVPGFAGANPTDSLRRDRIQYRTAVKKAIGDETNETSRGGVEDAFRRLMGEQVKLQVGSVPAGDLQGAVVIVKSGTIAGQVFPIREVAGDVIMVGPPMHPEPGDVRSARELKSGDQVHVDNSDFIAVQYYHRYQVPTADYYVWNQFRGADGKPIYPQRLKLMGPEFAASGAPMAQTGQFRGKMILLESLMDQDAFPWQADWYRSRVKAALGPRLDDNFRIWFTDHAAHADAENQSGSTHIISYLGVLHQALRDLSAWIEQGVAPPASTSYKVVDGQVLVPASASKRKGIQPTLILSANGAAIAEVSAGAPVTLSAKIQLPHNTGKIIAAEWDFEGEGKFQDVGQLSHADRSNKLLILTAKHVFSKPGTYFPTLRVASHRQGDATTPFARVQNLGRVRLVVK